MPVRGSSHDKFSNQVTFVRRNPKRGADERYVDLPGVVPANSPDPMSNQQRYTSDFPMESPGNAGGQESTFSGLYESDSKYKWKKIRGNLDLFVMERNERHLTSLQWKWQKMSRPRKRWSGGSGSTDGNGGYPAHLQSYHPHHPIGPHHVNTAFSPDYGTHHPSYPGYHYNPYNHHAYDQHVQNEEADRCAIMEEVLLKEQSEAEQQLHDLRKLLQNEKQMQDLSGSPDARLSRKIADIEEQIRELDRKLASTNAKLEANETRFQFDRRKSPSGESTEHRDFPPATPLFILGNPHMGSAAVVTQGHYVPEVTAGDAYSTTEFYSPSETLAAQQMEAAVEETKKQQVELKEDLQNQMQDLKVELEHQLAEQVAQAEAGAEMIFDARVKHLEKQIQEMNSKIRDTDVQIADSEAKQQRLRCLSEKSEHSWKKTTNHCSRDDMEDKPTSASSHRTNLLKKLSGHAGQVSPAPERKLSTAHDGSSLNDFKYGKTFFEDQNASNTPRAGSRRESTVDSFSSSTGTNRSSSKSTSFKASFKSSREASRRKHGSGRELTVTTLDSATTQMDEDITTINESESECISSNPAASAHKRKGGWGFKRNEKRKSLLYGLGTNWCVCPTKVWKYFGDEQDGEAITRRKCISIILGLVLVFLLLAIVIGLIIGLVGSPEKEESPIRFVVIPGPEQDDAAS